MSHRPGMLILTLALAALPFGPTHASVRATEVCPSLNMFSTVIGRTSAVTDRRHCYSTHGCFVGARGEWLDITNTREIARVPGAGPTADISFVEKGVDRFAPGCVPEARADREGFIKLKLENISGTGTLRIRLPRAGGSDVLNVIVRDGSTYLMMVEHSGMLPGETAERGFTGRNLDKLRIKTSGGGAASSIQSTISGLSNIQTSPSLAARQLPDAILSQTETAARARLTFATAGTISLEDKFQFEGGEPPLNRDLGWPTMRVAVPPPPPPAPLPNLVPILLRSELVRNFPHPTIPGIQVPSELCAGILPQQENDRALVFEWGVQNTSSVDISRQFTIELRTGDGTVLDTQAINGLAARQTRTFRNWPGRQAVVRVKNFNAAPRPPGSPTVVVIGGGKNGCWLISDPATIRFDPRPIVIVVDIGNRINESDDSERNNTRFIP